ncbi:MAG: FAD-dependent thymidylate synthase [Actinomycetota bacterium]|nr:FAD-dependent thymidylate synthase [Actinomycetota bacterium]
MTDQELPDHLASPEITPGDKPNELKLFEHGFVRLDAAMADDLSVVNSARVSFAVRREEMEERDKGLIKFLMRDRHGTPFEHNSFRFHVRTPIFVMREWIRHRISSFNEESGRYHKLGEDFYVPSPSAVRSQVGKPGSYSFEPVDDAVADETIDTFRRIYKELYAEYNGLLEKGVAKELARALLPVGIFTQFYWTLNARSLMNFLSLRNAEAAQYEIRTYAKAVERLFAQQMPLTHECFVEFGRRPP